MTVVMPVLGVWIVLVAGLVILGLASMFLEAFVKIIVRDELEKMVKLTEQREKVRLAEQRQRRKKGRR